MSANPIPMIDPRVRHIGVSKLRGLSAAELKRQSERKETLVVQVEDIPVAVVVSYDTYISIQQLVLSAQHSLANPSITK
jgi:hypothetical protein